MLGGNKMTRKNTLRVRALLALSVGLSFATASSAQSAPPRKMAGVAQLPAGAQRPVREVRLSIGEGELINLPAAVANVWVANPGVADVYVSSARQLNLFGRAAGETTVFATSAAGAVVYAATVRVTPNVSSLDDMLKAAMPEAEVKVTHVGSIAVLTGTVKSLEDSAQAETLVKGLLTNVTVINRLRNSMPMQVNLQVRFAEVSRSFVRRLGINYQTADFTSGFKYAAGQGRTITGSWSPGGPLGTASNAPSGATAVTAASGGTTIAIDGKLLGLNMLAALDAGETVGLVSTLAQPNLSALSGETADFLAGGEFPIPLSQGLGSTSIEYKRYGVSLAYTPTVLSSGRISLRVRPEVSELSSQGAVQLNGFQVPALTIRRAETTVELGSGQSFMIAGLMNNNNQNTIQKMPGAGDIPILGSLFRSTSFQKGETELVIVVTPYLVNPVNAADITLPTDGYQAPNELQRILGNMESDGKTGGARQGPKAAGGKAPDPAISMLQQVPAAAPAPTTTKGSAPRKQTAASNVPSPGFGLD